ncbi:MAG: GNAT family N-acetyltransferase [Bdellovibrionales bacterium]|nr:GNAT family N-acetyltransferase [Bdellovibrionales bacterium]
MSLRKKKSWIKDLEAAYLEERLVVKSNQKKLQYFIQFKKAFFGEFKEHFFHVTECFCQDDKKSRSAFYKEIKRLSLVMKKTEKIKRMAITVDVDDVVSREFFSKLGILTYTELVGDTKKSLKLLEKSISVNKSIKISKLKKEEINPLSKLDQASHIADKTSRMRGIFMKPDALKEMRNFYKMLLKNNACFVAKVDKKLAGNIGFFVDKKNKFGLIACIFVANDFKGRGVSKILYKTVLEEFKKRKLSHFIGASTTTGVLKLATQIGRKPSRHVYLVKIN